MSFEWQVKELDELCSLITDGSHRSPKSTEFGKPMASVKDMTNFGIDYESSRKISEEEYENLKRSGCCPKKGDVLIAKDGSVLETICVHNDERDVCLLSSIAIFRTNKDLDPYFLKYFFETPSTKHIAKSGYMTGSVIPRIVLKDFKTFPIKFPNIEKQKEISNFLKNIDEKIELNKKTIETLEGIAKALFKSWFIDFDPVRAKAEGRSTGFSNEISDLFPDSFEDSELGEIPGGWEISKISDICNSTDYVANGSFATLKKNVQKVDFYNGNEAILLRFADFNKNWEDDFSYITQDSYNFLDKSKVFPGDLVVCNVGDIGNFFRAPDLGLPMSLGPNGVLIKDFSLKGKLSNPYFYFLLSTNYFQFQLQSISSGSVQTKFNKTELRGLITLVPPKNIVKISTVLFDEILSKKDQLFIQNRILKNIRDTILPKLISGELRIPDAEKIIEEAGI